MFELNTRVAIVGGGIAGLTTAVALRKAGYSPVVFEAAPSFKPVGAGLALAANAIKAFDKLGIKNKVIEKGRILSSFTIKDQHGKTISFTDSRKVSEKYGIDNFTIHRSDLHEVLLSEIPRGLLVPGKRAVDCHTENDGKTQRIDFSDGSYHETDFVIVADGIHSPIRQKLVPGSQPRYAGYTCWRAVIDNSTLNIAESSETWGRKGRFGVVPLAGNRLYWFATITSTANNPKFRNFKVSDLLEWFAPYTKEVRDILALTSDDALIWNDVIDLKPISRFAFGNVLLIGDAAHATTPNMGQGACQAIEDAAVLYDELESDHDLPEVFQRFEKRRLKRTHFIVNQSASIGKIAQASNPIVVGLRNAFFRSIPERIKEKQFEKLFETDF